MQNKSFVDTIRVRRHPSRESMGLLEVDNKIMPCAVGRGGIGIKRGEGDGITPIGQFKLLRAMVRTDKFPVHAVRLSLEPIGPKSGWCDAVGDRNYNQPVTLPYLSSHEKLLRDDDLYDCAIVMDYNVNQRLSVGGSAIFFHLAHEGYAPTEGCVAVSRHHMLQLLPRVGRNTVMKIG